MLSTNEKIVNNRVIAKAGFSKEKLNDICRKTPEIPFCEPGASEKVDFHTLKVALYKLYTASGFSVGDIAQVVMGSKSEIQEYLDSVRDQVEFG